MSESVSISVIMPVYNAEEYLKDALHDVLEQTLNNIEILCIDDGSTDESPAILRRFADKDDRIKIFTQKNKGAGAARNKGLREARGKYLSFLDADDLFEPDLFETVFRQAEKRNAEIVVYRSDRYHCMTGVYENALWTINDTDLPRTDVFAGTDVDDLFNTFSGWAWDKLYLRSFVMNNGLCFQEQTYINDRYFVETALAAADRICVNDRLLIHKRIHVPKALTTLYFEGGHWKCWLSALEAVRSWLKKEGQLSRHEKNYISFAARMILWNLDQFVDQNSFPDLFTSVKDQYLAKLGLLDKGSKFFYNVDDYTLIQKIQLISCDEYRWIRKLGRRDGSYLFPFEMVPRNSRIILYGAGKVGQAYYRQIRFTDWCDIAAWVDRDHADHMNIMDPVQTLITAHYDYVIIAVNDRKLAEEIQKSLTLLSVTDQQMIWRPPEISLSNGE